MAFRLEAYNLQSDCVRSIFTVARVGFFMEYNFNQQWAFEAAESECRILVDELIAAMPSESPRVLQILLSL